ncbi:MAG: HlyD family efflux transporter periplasmic adaptor subunit [Phycisphaerales bacterium]|nr:HlyD family efflux transporter periplasmic adaptor subunit [Phycisphaerales bacterium]
MIGKYLVPLLAAGGLLFAVWRVIETNRPVLAAPPIVPPATPDFASRISGAGLVEASSQNIALGTLVPGVVRDVAVVVGATVRRGDPLFKIDDRDRLADLEVRKAQLAAAQARLERLRRLPRDEDVPPVEARLSEARATLEDAETQYRLAEHADRRAVSVEVLERRRMAVLQAAARVSEVEAQLALLRSGAWQADIAVAEAEVTQAAAVVHQMEVEIDRLTVRSPVDGEVLQVNVRPGEYAAAGALATPLMIVGTVETLHVRVDIDENDAWRFKPDADAVAFVRGNRDLSAHLRYVRTEPFVVPKRSLTGDARERVDTRVLQVLYAFDRSALPVYVGQQMDVFIAAPPAGVRDDAAAASAARSPGEPR